MADDGLNSRRAGSVRESAQRTTWPDYEAQYLATALSKADKKYSTVGLSSTDGQPDDGARRL